MVSLQTCAVRGNGTERMCLKRPSTAGWAAEFPVSSSREQRASCRRRTAALQRVRATLPTRGHRDACRKSSVAQETPQQSLLVCHVMQLTTV